MNSKNHVIKFISLTMSTVLLLFSSHTKLDAKKLEDYDVHTYKSQQCGATFTYRKNNDGENTITLLSIKSVSGTKSVKITSPIGSYAVTRVADDFYYQSKRNQTSSEAFFATLSQNSKIFFENLKEFVGDVMFTLTPIINIFYLPARHLIVHYKDFEPYGTRKVIYIAENITEIDLPQCLEVGSSTFGYSKKKLKKVNLPKCEKIGWYALPKETKELCISKDIDLQSSSLRDGLQHLLDCGSVVKYIDENGQQVQVHSLSEFPNFDKYQQTS